MIYTGAARRDLVDAFGGWALQHRGHHAATYGEIPHLREELTLVWHSADAEVPGPNVIVVNRLPVREFLAWMHTYLPAVRPLTAFCRVVTPEEFERLARGAKPRSLVSLRAGAAGIIAAECIGVSRFAQIRDALNCSLSLPIARAVLAGYSADELRSISSAWLDTRIGPEHGNGPQIVMEFGEVWSVVARLYAEGEQASLSLFRSSAAVHEGTPIIANALHKASTSIGMAIGDSFPVAGFPDSANREERLRVVEQYARRLRGAPKSEASMTLGALINSVAPGTLAHVTVATALRDEFRSVLAWYGFFAGVSRRSLEGRLGGLWLHIQKLLGSPGSEFDKTSADISAAELVMLLPVDILKRSLGSMLGDELLVELAPTIYSTVKLNDSSSPNPRGASPASVDHDEALRKIEEGLRQINAGYLQLAADKHQKGTKTAGRRRSR